MSEQKQKNRGLGRGLSALMADVNVEEGTEETPRRADMTVPVDRIHPNPEQPRRNFNPDALAELASSIAAKGIIQPLIVRPSRETEGHYEIVAGERRWRASQQVQLHEIPVIVREFDDTEVLEVAIIENIQRADLNPVDEASGYRQLMDRFGHTQDQLATALGKSRSHIANQLRLLTLPDSVRSMMVEGQLSAGHARTLVGNENAADLAARIVKNNLSVRETEKLVKQGKDGAGSAKPKSSGSKEKDPDTVQIERDLAAALGMGVSIDHKEGGETGTVTLRYRDLAQLDDLLRILSGN